MLRDVMHDDKSYVILKEQSNSFLLHVTLFNCSLI